MKSGGVCLYGFSLMSLVSLHIWPMLAPISNLIGIRTSHGLYHQQRLVNDRMVHPESRIEAVNWLETD
jgi:hypothetical protein